MKAKLKLITVAMLGVGMTAILLAGISAMADVQGKIKVNQISKASDFE